MRKNEYDNFCKISKLFPERFNCNLIFVNNKMWGLTLINSKLKYGIVYTNGFVRVSDFFDSPEKLFEKTIKPVFVHVEQLTFYKHLKIKKSDKKELVKILST